MVTCWPELDLGNGRFFTHSSVLGTYTLPIVPTVGAIFNDIALREQCVVKTIWMVYWLNPVNLHITFKILVDKPGDLFLAAAQEKFHMWGLLLVKPATCPSRVVRLFLQLFPVLSVLTHSQFVSQSPLSLVPEVIALGLFVFSSTDIL